jgi:CRP/FNR family transcriptional regulator, polysaccharide utilization system transcription regulator
MKTILLIEDNNEMRENTTEILELDNYKVIAAKNGKEGVELAQKNKIDLIVCDVMMPVLDGYGVLHLLNKNPETASIPFIFLTAKAERSDLRKGMEMGADDYITKPFDDMELLNAVESRLKKNSLLKTEFSKNIGGFNDFISEAKSLQELATLSAERKVKIIKKKDSVFTEGSYPNGLYFITKGKVKTFKTNTDGKEFITGLYKEGDFIGYNAILEETNYNESAAALEDAEVCIVPKEDFFKLIYRNSSVSQKFIKMLSDNLAEKEEALLKLAYNSVRKRVAEALITLKNRYQKDSSTNFNMSISREDLSNIAGTSTETAIRTLSDFKEEKLIEINGGNITILNADKLEKMRN